MFSGHPLYTCLRRSTHFQPSKFSTPNFAWASSWAEPHYRSCLPQLKRSLHRNTYSRWSVSFHCSLSVRLAKNCLQGLCWCCLLSRLILIWNQISCSSGFACFNQSETPNLYFFPQIFPLECCQSQRDSDGHCLCWTKANFLRRHKDAFSKFKASISNLNLYFHFAECPAAS